MQEGGGIKALSWTSGGDMLAVLTPSNTLIVISCDAEVLVSKAFLNSMCGFNFHTLSHSMYIFRLRLRSLLTLTHLNHVLYAGEGILSI